MTRTINEDFNNMFDNPMEKINKLVEEAKALKEKRTKYEDITDDPTFTDQELEDNHTFEFEEMVTNYAIGE